MISASDGPRVEGDRVWELLDKRAVLLTELENHRADYREKLEAWPAYVAWRDVQARYKEEIDTIEHSIEDARLHRHQQTLPGVE